MMKSHSHKDTDQLLSCLMETVLSFYIRQLMCFKGYHFTGSLKREGVGLRLLPNQIGMYVMFIAIKY